MYESWKSHKKSPVIKRLRRSVSPLDPICSSTPVRRKKDDSFSDDSIFEKIATQAPVSSALKMYFFYFYNEK